MKLEKEDIFTIAGSLISFALAVLFLRIGGVSTGSVVNIQNTLLKSMLVQTGGTMSGIAALLSPFSGILISLILLILSFSFLAAHAYRNDERNAGLVTGIVEAVLTIILFPTVVGVFLAVAFLISCMYIIPLANTYGKELKKWVYFRTGSNSLGKVFLIINVLLALGLFFSVLSNVPAYQQSFKTELKESMAAALPSNIPGGQAIIDAQLDQALNAPFFQSYFSWLPVVTAVGAWVILEFLRNLILSNIGGLFTSLIIRIRED